MLSRSTIPLALVLSLPLVLTPRAYAGEFQSTEVVLPATQVSGSRSEDNRGMTLSGLKLSKLSRAVIAEPKHNPFVSKSWFVPPMNAHVVSIPKKVDRPAAPSLPFNYMGRIQEEGGRVVVFLTQDSNAYAVGEGDDINDSYRLESVSPTRLVLVYLPLNTKHTLNVSASDHEVETNSNEVSSDIESDVEPKVIEAGRVAGSGD